MPCVCSKRDAAPPSQAYSPPALVGTVFPVTALKGAPVADIVFAPHRAVYDLTLDDTGPGSGVAERDGPHRL